VPLQICVVPLDPAFQVPLHLSIIVQQANPAGTRSFVTQGPLLAVPKLGGTNATQFCRAVGALTAEATFGNWADLAHLTQNALRWDLALRSPFDAEVALLAFPHADAADLGERLALALSFGETAASTTTARSYADVAALRSLTGAALSTAFDSALVTNASGASSGVTAICAAACLARGGQYQSWHVMVATTWDVSGNAQLLDESWANVTGSTYGKALTHVDRRIYFAVSYVDSNDDHLTLYLLISVHQQLPTCVF
jgi:hypothetical protein